MDDDELLIAIADGDSNALKQLFDRHSGWLATRLRASLPPHVVEDVLQETFIAVWKGASRFRRSGPAGAWLWGIARRQAALWLRQHQHQSVPLDASITVASGLNPADEAMIRADIDAAMQSLGPAGNDDRRLAQLAFFEDRPVNEIAQHLDVPPGTVKSRMFALRRRLRAALTGRNGENERT